MGSFFDWLFMLHEIRFFNYIYLNISCLWYTLFNFFFNLLFFRKDIIIPTFLHPWIGQKFLSIIRYLFVDFSFYNITKLSKKKKAEIKFIDRLNSLNFINFKFDFAFFITYDIGFALLDFNCFYTDCFYALSLFWLYFIRSKFATRYMLVGTSVIYSCNLLDAELVSISILAMVDLENTIDINSSSIKWINSNKSTEYLQILWNSSNTDGFVRTELPFLDKSPFIYLDLTKPLLPLIDNKNLVDSNYISQKFEFNKFSLNISAVTNDHFSAKSFTMRSRQFYRTGVFWCLALTALTVLGPYYLFYGFAFILIFYFFYNIFFIIRSAILKIWKFLTVRLPYLLKHFFY